MQNQTGERARTIAPSCVGLVVLLVGLIVVGSATAQARSGHDTYRWLGELVSLDEGARAVTVTSRIVSREALADLAGLEAGDPILITWSGSNGVAHGIRSVARDDGSGLRESDRFRLRAKFVAADLTRRSLTFMVSGPPSSLKPVRASTRGTWATVTSPHRPAHGPAAVVGVTAYSQAGARRPGATTPAAGDTYRWQGELVSLNEGARALTVKSRIVSQEPLADVAGLDPGDPILISWSGFEDRADGIRAVARDEGSGLWGSDGFLLAAEFVAADPARQYLTFSVPPPAESVAMVQTLTQGTWATLSSPHRPSAGVAPVETVDAYASAQSQPNAGSTAPAGDTYRWHGELVSLDTAGRALTVTSRIVSPQAAAEAAELDAGDPIVITWSGFGDRANGIRAVARDDTGLWGSDRLLLKAEFVSVDPARQYLTFTVAPPTESVLTLRGLTRGAWATVTSPHRPSPELGAAVTVDAYAPVGTQRLVGPAPAADDAYRWHGELVSLDEGGRALTVKSRIVSEDGLADISGLDTGDPIVITWSGFENRADGIRAVARDDGSGLWGSDRLLLPATFVAIDSTRQHLTFAVAPPADSVSTLRTLTRGAWATASSPHRPSPGARAVVTVDAYASAQRPRWAGPAPAAGDTYRWHGQVVSLDEAGPALTVKSRVVSHEGAAAAAGLDAGDPILITWSGFEDRANGIRAVAPDDGSGLWGGDRFLLQAELVAMDPARQYLTFKVVPAVDRAALKMMQGLTPGDWAIVTASHRPSRGVEAAVTVDAYDPARRARRYVWSGELVSLDEAEGVVAVSAPVEEHVFRYVDRFSEGDAIVLIWTPGDQEMVVAIRYLELREQSSLHHGYVLPAEFISADENSRRIILKTKVPARTVDTLTAVQPGTWIQVTSLFDQSGDSAAILTVQAASDDVE